MANGKLFKRIKRTDTHVAIAVNAERNGIIVKVDSNRLKGRGSTLKLNLKTIGAEAAVKRTIMFAAAEMANRQNVLWGDEHDLSEVAKKAAEAWYAVQKDHSYYHSFGTLVPFSPHSMQHDEKQLKRVSRASEDDPLTRDIGKGRLSKWGLDGQD